MSFAIWTKIYCDSFGALHLAKNMAIIFRRTSCFRTHLSHLQRNAIRFEVQFDQRLFDMCNYCMRIEYRCCHCGTSGSGSWFRWPIVQCGFWIWPMCVGRLIVAVCSCLVFVQEAIPSHWYRVDLCEFVVWVRETFTYVPITWAPYHHRRRRQRNKLLQYHLFAFLCLCC